MLGLGVDATEVGLSDGSPVPTNDPEQLPRPIPAELLARASAVVRASLGGRQGTMPDDPACLAMAGEAWEIVDRAARLGERDVRGGRLPGEPTVVDLLSLRLRPRLRVPIARFAKGERSFNGDGGFNPPPFTSGELRDEGDFTPGNLGSRPTASNILSLRNVGTSLVFELVLTLMADPVDYKMKRVDDAVQASLDPPKPPVVIDTAALHDALFDPVPPEPADAETAPPSGYPRMDLPLAPRCLEDLLAVPSEVLGANVLLNELDERVWSKYGTRTCLALASEVVAVLDLGGSLENPLAARELPGKPSFPDILSLRVSRRIRNIIFRHWAANGSTREMLTGVAPSMGDLLRLKNMGSR